MLSFRCHSALNRFKSYSKVWIADYEHIFNLSLYIKPPNFLKGFMLCVVEAYTVSTQLIWLENRLLSFHMSKKIQIIYRVLESYSPSINNCIYCKNKTCQCDSTFLTNLKGKSVLDVLKLNFHLQLDSKVFPNYFKCESFSINFWIPT